LQELLGDVDELARRLGVTEEVARDVRQRALAEALRGATGARIV
jgi:hypothetical protein